MQLLCNTWLFIFINILYMNMILRLCLSFLKILSSSCVHFIKYLISLGTTLFQPFVIIAEWVSAEYCMLMTKLFIWERLETEDYSSLQNKGNKKILWQNKMYSIHSKAFSSWSLLFCDSINYAHGTIPYWEEAHSEQPSRERICI